MHPHLPVPQNKCWVKSPSGWVREPGQPSITSGLVTALTVQDYSAGPPAEPTATAPPPPALSSPPLSTIAPDSRPTSIGMLLTRLQAPLFGNATWREPPPGYQEGQCFVLLNRNANGTTLQDIAVGRESSCLMPTCGLIGRTALPPCWMTGCRQEPPFQAGLPASLLPRLPAPPGL